LKRKFKAGSTSQTIEVYIQDSSSTTGGALTGLAHNSSGLTCYYHRQGAASAASVSLAASTLGTWTSGGFKEVDGSNMPGHYELGIPDAVLASGARYVTLLLKGAANMVPVPIEIELDAVDYQDAVSFGLSRLDADVSSRLAPTTAGRTLDVSSSGNAGIDWGNIENPTTVQDFSGTTVQAAGTVGNLEAGSITSDSFETGAIGSAELTPESLDEIAAAVASSILSNTSNLLATDSTGRVTVGSNADKTGYSLNLAQTGLSPRALDSVGDSSLTVGDALVAAICGAAGEETVVGTTYTVKTPSTATPIRTFTLDSATAPTSRT
jgi:hypothetical protein